MKLDFTKVVSITTDGAPAMVGKRKDAVGLLQKDLEGIGRNDKITNIHCLFHLETLCAWITNFKSVMDTVLKAVNVLLSRKINHRQLRQFQLKAENNYGDLLYLQCSLTQSRSYA